MEAKKHFGERASTHIGGVCDLISPNLAEQGQSYLNDA
jgi:hypothetical protein